MAKAKPPERLGERIQFRSRMNTWVGRVRPPGAARGRWMDLCTADETLAQERYNRWHTTGEEPVQSGKETFARASARIVDAQEALRSKDATGAKLANVAKEAQNRRTRLRDYALPILGTMEVARIKPNHVASVIDRMVKGGKLSGTVLKMRSDISQVLGELMREGAVEFNFARALPLSKDAKVDARPRVRMSDAHMLAFRAARGFETQLDMMVLFSRDVAGHRTSDEHAGDWSGVDTVGFDTMQVRRPKTDGEDGARVGVAKHRAKAYELVLHGIPRTVKGPLEAYWRQQGQPTSGPIFPLLRPSKAGVVRRKDGTVYRRQASEAGGFKSAGSSYAKALRQAVWDAAIYSPLPGFDAAHPRKQFCAYQTDTGVSRRLSFHSIRGSYITAQSMAGASMQDVLDTSGHTQETTSHSYRGARRVETLPGALPGGAKPPAPAPVSPTPTPTPAPVAPAGPSNEALLAVLESMRAALSASKSDPGSAPAEVADPGFGSKLSRPSVPEGVKYSDYLASPRGVEPLTNALGMRGRSPQDSFPAGLAPPVALLSNADEPVLTHVLGQATTSETRVKLAQLDSAIEEAALSGRWSTVDLLQGRAAALRQSGLTNVTSIALARKRRDEGGGK